MLKGGRPEDEDDFKSAVIVVPCYPKAEHLDVMSKLLMVFDYFDKTHNQCWNENAFRSWQSRLKKPQKATWKSTLEFYEKEYWIIIDQRKGKS